MGFTTWSYVALVFFGASPATVAQPRTQDEAPSEPRTRTRIELRVIAVLDARRATIDRGTRDGLIVDDELVLLPRGGGRYRARVVAVDERAAEIELVDLGLRATLGMRGETWLPARRFAAEPAPRPDAETAADEPSSDYPWRNQDESWEPGSYLLAGVSPPRPADRDALLRGRIYSSFDGIFPSEGGRTSRLARMGADVTYQNLTGRGDDLRIAAEWNQRNFDLPEQDDVETSRLRIDRLSYVRGGHRFDRRRLEFGRFLQHGMPAFGLLDGVEYTQRTEGGHGYGASVGFLPTPEYTLETGHDFQIAAWTRWSADESEELTASAGFQKTWHNGAADRDLFVLESRFAPREGWNAYGTLWIDFYSSGDDIKGSGPELTQAFLQASRDYDGEWGLGVTYQHFAFPQLDREEFFPPVQANQLENDFVDRLGIDVWWEALRDGRWLARLGVWNDQDDSGGDVDVGIELRDRLGSGSRLTLNIFGVEGAFTRAVGARAGVGLAGRALYSDLFYEYTSHDQHGFSSEFDGILQHRVRGSVGWRPAADWSFSAYVDGIDRETERSAALGAYLQWHF